MTMLKRILFVVIIISSFLLGISGCAGFKDIDKRFFVAGIGIDKAEDPSQLFKITLKLAIPNSEPKKGGSNFVTYTEESKSIAEAVRIVKAKIDKELDFGQLKIILFGEDFSSENMSPAIDWLMRRRDIQKIALMGIGEPRAKDVLETKPPFENQPSDVLILSLNGTGTESNYITLEYLFDFYRRKTELGIDPILPIIENKHKNNNEYFIINRLALFNKVDKLNVKLKLSPEETKLYNLIINEKTEASIRIETKEIAFVINVQKVKMAYTIQPSKIQFNVKISGIIEESSKQILPDDLKKYQKQASMHLQEKIEHLLKKMQRSQVDPMGFGLHYRSRNWHNRTKWEEWKKLYPKLKFTVNVPVKIRSTGLIK